MGAFSHVPTPRLLLSVGPERSQIACRALVCGRVALGRWGEHDSNNVPSLSSMYALCT